MLWSPFGFSKYPHTMNPMTGEQWNQVKDLFEAAQAQSPEQRPTWLAEACPDREIRDEVTSLLAAYERAGDFIEQPASGEAVAILTKVGPDSRRGEILGAWRLVDEIGRGGMGT